MSLFGFFGGSKPSKPGYEELVLEAAARVADYAESREADLRSAEYLNRGAAQVARDKVAEAEAFGDAQAAEYYRNQAAMHEMQATCSEVERLTPRELSSNVAVRLRRLTKRMGILPAASQTALPEATLPMADPKARQSDIGPSAPRRGLNGESPATK
jgi:hypothetical protein